MRKILLLTSLLISVHTFSQQWICFHGGVTSGFQPMVNCLDYDSASDKLYVAGSFWSLDTITAYSPSVWDGTHWVMFPPAGNIVSGGANAALLACSDYWIASTNPSTPSYRVYRINTVTYQYDIWSANGEVNDLCWWNDKLVAVGNFTVIDGVPCDGVATYDTTTQAWSSLGGAFGGWSSDKFCCYSWQGKLVVGGCFMNCATLTCNSIACFDTTGQDHWTNLGNGVKTSGTPGLGNVYSFAEYNGQLYAGGLFTIPGDNLAWFDGTDWVDAGVNNVNTISSIYPFHDKLILGESAAYFYDGISAQLIGDSPYGGVEAITSFKDELVIGGVFQLSISHADTLNRLARWTDVPVDRTDNLCMNDCNGTAQVDTSYGYPGPYHYAWDTPNNDTTPTVSNLCSGIYHVTITDGDGQVHYGTCTIVSSDSFSISNMTTNATCSTCANGSASIGTTAIAPLQIIWSTGDTTTNIINQLPGTYTVCITDSNGCTQCDTVVINYNNGVSEIESREFIITPNPTQDIINISGTKTGEHILCENLLGQVVYSTNCENEKTLMNVSELASGVYLLVIADKEGVVVVRKKVVKE